MPTTKAPHKNVDPMARALRALAKTPGGDAFGEILRALKVRLPARDVPPVSVWLKRLHVAGDKTQTNTTCPTIVSVVCPDYTTQTDPRTGRAYYTFDALGDGVGLVAERAFRAQARLWTFFKDQGRSVRFIIAMADNEAHSEANCKRVDLTQQEFVKRMRQSQKALAAMAIGCMTLETPFLTEIHPEAWKCRMESARFLGDNPEWIDPKNIQRAVNERRSFYKRWAGTHLTEKELADMVLSQAPEYAAVGAYLHDVLPDALILAADSPVMAPFVRLLTGPALPLLNLERESYH